MTRVGSSELSITIFVPSADVSGDAADIIIYHALYLFNAGLRIVLEGCHELQVEMRREMPGAAPLLMRIQPDLVVESAGLVPPELSL